MRQIKGWCILRIKVIFGIGLILILLGGSFYAINHPLIHHVQASYAQILSDTEATIKAKDIIIGKVEKNLNSYEFDGKIVRTDSLIHIEKSLKGDLTGNIAFSQEGGRTKVAGYVIFDNYEILKPGSRYLLFLDKFPRDYISEHPEQTDKFLSVGGPFSVYKIEGKHAKNAIQTSLDRDYEGLVKEVQDTLVKNKPN